MEENEASSQALAAIREFIATLPQDSSWKLYQPLRLYQGYWHVPLFLESAIFAQQNFRAHPDDVFVCSAPKTGTTWLKALCFATATRTAYENDSPLLTNVPHDCIPFLERDFFKNYGKRRVPDENDLHLWSTHLSYSSLPKSAIDSDCKIVYIWRDPKDVFVSTWHFIGKLGSGNLSMEVAFESFCEGTTIWGPYWDHVLGYWKASLDRPDKVLFLKYEEMMEDAAFYLRRIAKFMGFPFSAEEEAEGVIQRIVELCSFDNLSNLEVNKTGQHRADEGVPVNNNAYFRKAKVGDWRNNLSLEMAERLDQITKFKFKGSGLL